MKALKCLAGLLLLALAVGCGGTSTTPGKEKDKAGSMSDVLADPAKAATAVLVKNKDKLLEEVGKMIPEAEKVLGLLKDKLGSASGEGKSAIETLITKISDIIKVIQGKVEVLKKTEGTAIADKLTDLTKDSGSLTELLAKAKELLK